MATLNPYIFFDGNCADAMSFYQKAIGARLEMMMRYSESPEATKNPLPPGASDPVIHARLVKDQFVLMASDNRPGQPYPGAKGFSLALTFDTVDEARRCFDALSESGQVVMPMSETFWAQAFGVVHDRYGMPWMVNGGMKALA